MQSTPSSQESCWHTTALHLSTGRRSSATPRLHPSRFTSIIVLAFSFRTGKTDSCLHLCSLGVSAIFVLSQIYICHICLDSKLALCNLTLKDMLYSNSHSKLQHGQFKLYDKSLELPSSTVFLLFNSGCHLVLVIMKWEPEHAELACWGAQYHRLWTTYQSRTTSSASFCMDIISCVCWAKLYQHTIFNEQWNTGVDSTMLFCLHESHTLMVASRKEHGSPETVIGCGKLMFMHERRSSRTLVSSLDCVGRTRQAGIRIPICHTSRIPCPEPQYVPASKGLWQWRNDCVL